MNKNSRTLIVLSLILLFLLGSNIFIMYQLTANIKKDAEVINQAGLIRGSIQRLAKLELNGIRADEVVENTDSIIRSFDGYVLSFKGKNLGFWNLFAQLSTKWEAFKEKLYEFRTEPSPANADSVMYESEQIWIAADAMVLAAERFSEKKVNNFNYLIALLFVNLIPIAAILLYVRRYIKGKLELLANVDPLTKAYNRNFLYSLLDNEIKRLDRSMGSLSLIMLDIDFFKQINDSFGHGIGDSVLVELTERMKANTRKSDVVARIGGEEFLIVAVNTPLENAKTLAEKIRESVVAQDFKNAGKVTVSIGVSSFVCGDNFDSLYKRADTALYQAKRSGRDRIEVSLPTS